MAYDPITSWQIEGEKVEAVTDFFFFFLSQKSLWMVTIAIRDLLLGRKFMTNLDSILGKNITLLTKVCLSKLWFFQYSCTEVKVGP